jgi:dienelactone hydrolase
MTPMTFPDGWTQGSHTHEGVNHATYRRGQGPGVIVIHEIPGITPAVAAFGQEVVDAGYTVVMPSLFGTDGAKMTPLAVGRALRQVCVSREFTTLRRGVTTPVAGWLRSLARELHGELGGPGVGALGMCFTGGFALAMMVDAPIAAPVVCQPSTPFVLGAKRGADLNLSTADLDIVKGRCAAGQQVLGLQFRTDPLTGTRFDTLTRELGPAFIRIELDGMGHSTVTEHRKPVAVDAVLGFLADNLR